MAKGIINHSDEFRKLLFQQSDRYNIPFAHICVHLGIDYERFLGKYANVKMLSDEDNLTMSDGDLIKMAKMLGVDVRFVLVVKDEKKFEQEIDALKRKLRDEYINRKKAKPAASVK